MSAMDKMIENQLDSIINQATALRAGTVTNRQAALSLLAENVDRLRSWEKLGQTDKGFAKIEENRVETARSHDYESDPEFTATATGDADCRICGQPKRYHR